MSPEKGAEAVRLKGPMRATDGLVRGTIIGPSDVEVGRWIVVRPEEDLVTKDDGAVGQICGVAVPSTPPAGTGVAVVGAVVWVVAVKIDGVNASVVIIGGCRTIKAALEVHSKNKVPARAEGSFREGLDKEYVVGACQENRVVKLPSRGRWN